MLGVLLLGVRVLALLRRTNTKNGVGTFKALGIEVMDNNGSSLLLLVGASCVAAGFGSASTRSEAEQAKSDADPAVTEADLAREELVEADADLTRIETVDAALRTKIEARPPSERASLANATQVRRAWRPRPRMLQPLPPRRR